MDLLHIDVSIRVDLGTIPAYEPAKFFDPACVSRYNHENYCPFAQGSGDSCSFLSKVSS